MQWGSGSYTGAQDSSQNFTLPIAYPTAHFGVIGTIGSSLSTHNMGFQTGTTPLTSISVGYHDTAGAAATALLFTYMSLGY